MPSRRWRRDDSSADTGGCGHQSGRVCGTTSRDRTPATRSPVINIEPSASWFSLGLGELWAYRELLYFLDLA